MNLDSGPAEPMAPEDLVPLVVPRQRARRAARVVVELLHDLTIAALLSFFLITFVAQAFRVQGTSMLPLLSNGDRIIVDKLTYRFQDIRRGDVVVFWYPRDPSVSFIKRIVGLPGETVEIRRGVVMVDGRPRVESYLSGQHRDQDNHPPTRVSPGHYFVLGDHRSSSNDSRNWGEVPKKYVYGKAFFRFWPPGDFGYVP